MEYINISKPDKKIINEQLVILWKQIYYFQNTGIFQQMELKDRREYKKIEDRLFRLTKNYYTNDLLQQKSNTT